MLLPPPVAPQHRAVRCAVAGTLACLLLSLEGLVCYEHIPPPVPADEKVEYAYINLLRNAERYTGCAALPTKRRRTPRRCLPAAAPLAALVGPALGVVAPLLRPPHHGRVLFDAAASHMCEPARLLASAGTRASTRHACGAPSTPRQALLAELQIGANVCFCLGLIRSTMRCTAAQPTCNCPPCLHLAPATPLPPPPQDMFKGINDPATPPEQRVFYR